MSQLRAPSDGGLALRFTFNCDLPSVRPTALAVRQVLAAHRPSEADLTACELALVEACNNAILYATEAGRRQEVEIQIWSDGPGLEIHVIDHTAGFDWPGEPRLPDPDAEHGRGLFIIHSVMDEAFYLRGHHQNRLVMRKTGFFQGRLSEGKMSIELTETREKLALTEQVISGMAKELWTQISSARAHQEESERRLLAHELEIARKIQHSLLPKSFPRLTGFGLSGFCWSARHVGGDFYDVLPISPGLALLVVADVMGKGVPAALFAATLRTLLRTMIQWTRRPSKLLRRINRQMHEDLAGVDMFITAQLALVDSRVGRLIVSSAGHTPLLVSDGLGEIEAVSPEGMPLGILPEAEFEESLISITPAGCAFLYSDGLTEARNSGGELFGIQRLQQWLLQNLASGLTADQLSENIQAELKRFQGSIIPADDQTFLILAGEPKPRRAPAATPEFAELAAATGLRVSSSRQGGSV